MPRTKSSKRWLQEHFNDAFVKKAQINGYRSRAAYKLAEIDARDQLLKPGMTVVELGAAPGSWTQYICTKLKGNGIIVAVDLLPMTQLDNVHFILGDLQEDEIWEKLRAIIPEHSVNLLLSDLAPNITGIDAVDTSRAMDLVELAIDCSCKLLMPKGGVLIKMFHGAGFENLIRKAHLHFGKVVLRKPTASRSRSREVYLLAKNYKLS